MRFLVRLEAHLPEDLAAQELERLNAAETARGIALREAGVIEHIWRLEGRRANVGVWRAADRSALDEALDSLPLRPWLEIAEVVVLVPHPVGGDDGRAPGSGTRP
ncbi:muconolactone D-isomerase [Marmoricola sp. URHA0025 HA25]